MPGQGFWKGERETGDPATRNARLRARLAEHAADLAGRSPSIARRLAEASVTPADLADPAGLAQVAPVTKPEIIADQAAKPPYGTLMGADAADIVRIYVGPGPQLTYFTRDDLAATVAHGSWAFWTNGFRSEDVVDVTIMYHWVIAGTLMDDAYRQIGCATIPGGIGMGQSHLDNLALVRATGMFAFPTFLEELANKAAEAGIDSARELNLRLCTIAGELRSADVHQRMEAFWGMKVREIYGGAEVPFIAAECDHGGGMHLNPDFIVEVVDPQTRLPVPAGTPGVVVATEIERTAYPMIRYWTGDITAGLDESPCGCGRTTPRMGRILGRVGDIPRVKGLFVIPGQVGRSLSAVPGLGRFQLVVARPGTQDTLTVRIEHAGPAQQRADLVPAIASRLKDGIRLSCEVELIDPGTLAADAPVVVDTRSV